MWPFLNKQPQPGSKQSEEVERGRPMKFSQIVEGMGDFRDLANHDIAMKFWLPEPALDALREMCALNGDSVSETLRQFFAHHCYGIYAFQLMNKKVPGLFKDADQRIFFSLNDLPADVQKPGSPSQLPATKRIDTYWVPELGKNVMPIKVWVPTRLRKDLQVLADHVELNLSQYAREIVISRLLGHGTLPYRPEMLHAIPLPAAQDWCDGKPVGMREVDAKEQSRYLEVTTRSVEVDAPQG